MWPLCGLRGLIAIATETNSIHNVHFLCKSHEMWLQTRLCGWLYKKNKPYFTNNVASPLMRTLTDIYITVAIEASSHIQSTMWFFFWKDLWIAQKCPVTIEAKATSNPHCGFFLNETSDRAISSSSHRNKSHIQSRLLVFL